MSQSLDMDAGKGINKDFVYFIGRKPTEASLVKDHDHDAQNMKVEDFRRPMSMFLDAIASLQLGMLP